VPSIGFFASIITLCVWNVVLRGKNTCISFWIRHLVSTVITTAIGSWRQLCKTWLTVTYHWRVSYEYSTIQLTNIICFKLYRNSTNISQYGSQASSITYMFLIASFSFSQKIVLVSTTGKRLVHTTPEEFENGGLILKTRIKCFPFTLRRRNL